MKPNRPSPVYSALKALCILLGIVLAGMLCATAYFHHLFSQVNYVPEDPVTSLVHDAVEAFLPNETASHSQTSDDSINILLIGQDSRGGSDAARSDSMILCTFHKGSNTLTMTSFLRDLYLPIPGHGSNRINAAYSYGGMSLLKKTLEDNFLLDIDGCVEVDFSQFAEIIDLLGGVTLELRQDEADIINRETGSTLTQGRQLLSGSQALTYSRIRKLDRDGDFSRTGRQRKVMGALLEAYKTSSIPTMLLLLDEILPLITTDLKTGRILTLALEVFPHMSGLQVTSRCIPAEGTYTDQTIDGMSVLVADLEAARSLLHAGS